MATKTCFYHLAETFARGHPAPVTRAHKIIVRHVRPPIPNADHWRAYSDNLGADTSPYGTGPDEASAIEDLMWQLEELEDEV